MSRRNVTRGSGWLEKTLARIRANAVNRRIPPQLRQGSLLDIGCGTFPYFLTHTAFAEKVGLDQVIDQAATDDMAARGITLVRHDAAQADVLPFDDERFDVVTMLAVFEHVPRPALVQLMREIRRVLKPGGCYLLTTPAAWADPFLRLCAALGLVSAEEIDEHQARYTHARIRRILTEGGFDSGKIDMGYFGLGLNIWVRVRK